MEVLKISEIDLARAILLNVVSESDYKFKFNFNKFDTLFLF